MLTERVLPNGNVAQARYVMQYMDVFIKSAAEAAGGTRTEAKQQALAWLSAQLRWERTLDHLRDGEAEPAPRAA